MATVSRLFLRTGGTYPFPCLSGRASLDCSPPPLLRHAQIHQDMSFEMCGTRDLLDHEREWWSARYLGQVEDVNNMSPRAKAGCFEEFPGNREEQNSIMPHEMMERRGDGSLAEDRVNPGPALVSNQGRSCCRN